jgi:superfamily II DNA or RNA helicase
VEAVVTNYEELKVKKRYVGLPIPTNSLVIFDEAHRCGGRNTANGEMLRYFFDAGHRILLLSATLAISPLRFNEIGYCLGLYHNKSAQWRWMISHGVRKGVFGGLEFCDKSGVHLKDIHDQLIPKCGVRVTTNDIPDFPLNYVYSRVMDADLPTTQLKAVDQSWSILEVLNDKSTSFGESDSAQSDRMRQYHGQMAFLEGIRLHLYPDIIAPLIEEGKSVVVFLRYRSSLDALNVLMEPYKIKCSYIIGGQTEKQREEQVTAFQTNKIHLCLAMLPAGGVGLSLHDLHGRQRYSLLSPSFDAVQFQQALGRICRIGSKSKAVQAIIYLAGTKEEKIAKGMEDRLRQLEIINDGEYNKQTDEEKELND